ncbi:MAG TPA: FG-GAP-like repeat-containing protein, partial [Chloroflexia bacterium]|nr:FG-GAP-like repeat-containing protein [Chloroflexia bacterium]
FGPATNYFVGTEPSSVAVGDFNRDGNLDLVVANFYSNTVSVLLGDGSGGFGAPTNFPVGTEPRSVAVGDFNRDGILDLAVANNSANNVSILLGNGDGTFGAATNFPVGSGPWSVVVGDFNRDGILDLAVANGGSITVSVLLGNGSGGFGAPTNFPVGSGPTSIAVGDFNRDGNRDLAVANFYSQSVSILLGNGSGGFSGPTNFGVGGTPRAVAAGDFTHNGILDLAVVTFNTTTVWVLLGNGSGGFGPATSFAIGIQPVAVAVADFNRDGSADLLAVNSGDDDVAVLLNSCAPPPTPTPRLTPLPTLTRTTTPTPTLTPTPTPGAQTATPTSTPSATPVPPTQTPGGPSATPVPTYTSVPPTQTPGPSPPPCTINFSDVHPIDYFYVPVQYLYCHGVISGYADGTFRPFNNTTRSQMVKIIVLGFNKPLSTPPGGAYTFEDVPPSNPFVVYVETAAAYAIVSGYTCGQAPVGPCVPPLNRPYFLPYAYVTRGQLSKIDVVAAGWPLLNPANRTFEDVLPGSAFYSFVETAVSRGVLSGYTCGSPPAGPCVPPTNRPYFLSGNNATRGQIAKIGYLSILAAGLARWPVLAGLAPPTPGGPDHPRPLSRVRWSQIPGVYGVYAGICRRDYQAPPCIRVCYNAGHCDFLAAPDPRPGGTHDRLPCCSGLPRGPPAGHDPARAGSARGPRPGRPGRRGASARRTRPITPGASRVRRGHRLLGTGPHPGPRPGAAPRRSRAA